MRRNAFRKDCAINIEYFQEMSPGDFERSMTDLMRYLGFHAEQTQLTADGGIDIWAVDSRPIVGGRIIIQCKRYATGVSVGEPAVRELYGLVHAHGVTKGIVITTSHFTASALRFASGKPLELVDGVGLASLMAGVGAGFIMPSSENCHTREFCDFDVVLDELREWRSRYSQPYPLRYRITERRLLKGTIEQFVNVLISTCTDVDGKMLDMNLDGHFSPEILRVVDYLKAAFLLLQNARFRPLDEREPYYLSEEFTEWPEVSLTEWPFWQAATDSASDEVLAGLKHVCGLIQSIADVENVTLVLDEYIYENPRPDCEMDKVQADIEKHCLRFWWKPHSSR